MIKPLERLSLESIGVEIAKYTFEIVTFYIFLKEYKINSGKAGLLDCYIIMKLINI